MPEYRIEQYEIHGQQYRVEAENVADAITKLLDGEAAPVDGSLEYIEICEDRGLPADEHRELADQLRSLGVPVGDHVIPSIRTVVQVKESVQRTPSKSV
jgi:hypothetical protein